MPHGSIVGFTVSIGANMNDPWLTIIFHSGSNCLILSIHSYTLPSSSAESTKLESFR